jgi:Mg-chelatase subunit ChlD
MVRALYKAAAVASVAVLLGLLRGSDGKETGQSVESYTPLIIAEQTNVSKGGPPPYCVWRDDQGLYVPVPLQASATESLYACHDLCSGDASCVGVSTNSRPGSSGKDCALVSAAHLSEFQTSGGTTPGCLSDTGHRFYTKVTTRFASSCSDEYDLVWVVDESGSIGEVNWRNMVAFLNDATASLSRSRRRVLGSSLVQYFGTKAHALEQTEKDPAGFQATLSAHVYPTSEATNIEQGLAKGLIARKLLGEDRKVVVVLVTDGVPNRFGENASRGLSLASSKSQEAARKIIAEANTTLVYSYIPEGFALVEYQETLFDRSEIITLRNMPSGFSDLDVPGLFADAGAAAPVSVRAEASSPPSWVVTMASESDAIAAVASVKEFQGTKYVTLYEGPSIVSDSDVAALFISAGAPQPVLVGKAGVDQFSGLQVWSVTMATESDAAAAIARIAAFDYTISVFPLSLDLSNIRMTSMIAEDRKLKLDVDPPQRCQEKACFSSSTGWDLTPILKMLENVLGELVCATKIPTASPTTLEPSKAPSVAPTLAPSKAPTAAPTAAPTVAPTSTPSVHPTHAPTQKPTAKPAAEPTELVISSPTRKPATRKPTSSPDEEDEVIDNRPEGCVGKSYDIALIVDQSGSVGKTNDATQRAAIKAFISQFNIGPGMLQDRVSYTTFASKVRANADFNAASATDFRAFSKIVDSFAAETTSSPLSGTGTGGGLYVAQQSFARASRPRPRSLDLVKVAIIITDGMPNAIDSCGQVDPRNFKSAKGLSVGAKEALALKCARTAFSQLRSSVDKFAFINMGDPTKVATQSHVSSTSKLFEGKEDIYIKSTYPEIAKAMRFITEGLCSPERGQSGTGR